MGFETHGVIYISIVLRQQQLRRILYARHTGSTVNLWLMLKSLKKEVKELFKNPDIRVIMLRMMRSVLTSKK